MSTPTFGGHAKSVGALAKALASDGLERTNREVGNLAKQIAANAASVDLGGDPKFSGWAPRLDTKYRSLRKPQQGVVISPTRSSAGPWTVAQYGRNQAFGPAFTGPRLTKTGRVSKARTKRYNGQTDPKFTATDASAQFESELPRLVAKGVFALTRKHLGR